MHLLHMWPLLHWLTSAQVAALQHDSGTYLDEPEDWADFSSWSRSFR